MILDHSLLGASQISPQVGTRPEDAKSSSPTIPGQSFLLPVQYSPIPPASTDRRVPSQPNTYEDSDILEYLEFIGDEIIDEFDILFNSMVLESTMCDIEISAMNLSAIIGFPEEADFFISFDDDEYYCAENHDIDFLSYDYEIDETLDQAEIRYDCI